MINGELAFSYNQDIMKTRCYISFYLKFGPLVVNFLRTPVFVLTLELGLKKSLCFTNTLLYFFSELEFQTITEIMADFM